MDIDYRTFSELTPSHALEVLQVQVSVIIKLEILTLSFFIKYFFIVFFMNASYLIRKISNMFLISFD